MKNKTKFTLDNTDSIEKFEEYFNNFFQKETGFATKQFDLKKWHLKCLNDSSNGSRVFTAIFALKICYSLTEINFLKSRLLWNNNFAHKENIVDSILENYDDFETCFLLMNHLNSFVYNYRASWDKIMGLYILQNIPEKYERFRKSKSRKTEFKRICANASFISSDDLNIIFSLLEDFDNKYRTPEAHATGSMRNWVLKPYENKHFSYSNPNYEVTAFWNVLVYFVNLLNDF